MKNVLLLVVGAAAGFVAAHYVNKTPQGRAFFAQVDAQTEAFSQAVVEGYKAREAEIREAVATARAAFDDLADRD